MIRLAEYIRNNVSFPDDPDGREFTRGQIIYSGQVPNDPINVLQVLNTGGAFQPGPMFGFATVQIIARAESSGYAYDLLHAVYNSPAFGGSPELPCYKRYMNKFAIHGVDSAGLSLPDLKIESLHPSQRPLDLGAWQGGSAWSVNYELKFLD